MTDQHCVGCPDSVIFKNPQFPKSKILNPLFCIIGLCIVDFVFSCQKVDKTPSESKISFLTKQVNIGAKNSRILSLLQISRNISEKMH
jgi:hypothetical protein